MESFIKADIFFFISSLATVVLAVFLSVLLFYLIKAGKSLYKLSEALEKDFAASEDFVAELRERLESNLAFRLFFPPLRKKWRAARKGDNIKKSH